MPVPDLLGDALESTLSACQIGIRSAEHTWTTEADVPTIRRPLIAVGAVALVLLLVPGASASTPVKIGPDQYVAGEVNARQVGAEIFTNCPLPGTGTGHPLPNQTVEVVPATASTPASDACFSGGGVTFPTWLILPANTGDAFLANFTYYNAPAAIPTSIWIPCSGSITVRFVAYPASGGGSTAVLPVTFVPEP
jgi:hypothetical protein